MSAGTIGLASAVDLALILHEHVALQMTTQTAFVIVSTLSWTGGIMVEST